MHHTTCDVCEKEEGYLEGSVDKGWCVFKSIVFLGEENKNMTWIDKHMCPTCWEKVDRFIASISVKPNF